MTDSDSTQVRYLQAAALQTTDRLVGIGTVVALQVVGVFMVVRVAGDQWSLSTGRLHTVEWDVVFHCTDEPAVYL